MNRTVRVLIICVGWVVIFWLLAMPGWRPATKLPISQLKLDDLGALMWSYSWRLAAVWILATITFSSNAAPAHRELAKKPQQPVVAPPA